MKKQATKAEKAFLLLIVLVAWFALVMQLYLNILNRTTPLYESLTRFFTYYTILTNILVAVSCTFLLLSPGSTRGRFFSRAGTLTAIAVYIFVVGLVYNVVLRTTWKPEGLQRVVDELLHVGTPVLFLLYWFVFAPKAGLQWKNALSWLIYPVLYGVVVLIRGAISGWYPYPFFEVPVLGGGRVAINAVGLITVFLVFSLLFVGMGKLMEGKSNTGGLK